MRRIMIMIMKVMSLNCDGSSDPMNDGLSDPNVDGPSDPAPQRNGSCVYLRRKCQNQVITGRVCPSPSPPHASPSGCARAGLAVQIL